MGTNGVEKAGIRAHVANLSNNTMPQKPMKKTENLQELLANPAKKEHTDGSFFQNHKTLSVLGGLFAAAIVLLGTRKLNMAMKVHAQNLAKKAHENFLQETRNFIKKETESFYKDTQSWLNIFTFEKNKTILEEALNKSPKEFFMTQEEYRGFIDFIKQNGLRNEIIPHRITNRGFSLTYSNLERNCNANHIKTADKLYYSQREMLNPDLAKIKSQISPRKVNLKEEDEMFRFYSSKDYMPQEAKRMLSEAENITLESGSLMKETYSREEFYDLPFKFASASYNSLAKNGNAYIKTEIPKIFNGINEKELFESFDILSTHLRGKIMSSFPEGAVINIKIGGKAFKCTSLGHGQEGSVFRISAEGQTPVILKTYYADSDRSASLVSFSPSGLYGGLGILREANMAKVADIQKLYMANPIYTPVNGARSRYMGAWQITEDATLRKAEQGLGFREWLKSKKLLWTDNKENAWVNDICVDSGFIMNLRTHTSLNHGWGNEFLNSLYSKYLNGETTRQILEFLGKMK